MDGRKFSLGSVWSFLIYTFKRLEMTTLYLGDVGGFSKMFWIPDLLSCNFRLAEILFYTTLVICLCITMCFSFFFLIILKLQYHCISMDTLSFIAGHKVELMKRKSKDIARLTLSGKPIEFFPYPSPGWFNPSQCQNFFYEMLGQVDKS